MELLVVALLTIFLLLSACGFRWSVRRVAACDGRDPRLVTDLAGDTISNHSEKYVPYLTAAGDVHSECNLIGCAGTRIAQRRSDCALVALFTGFYYH